MKRPRMLAYLEAFLKDRNVATIFPSSQSLIRRVIKALDLSGAETVVEYGPADGILTVSLLKHLGPKATLVAIELNPGFYRALKGKVKDPRLKAVRGDVRKVREILSGLGIEKADRVVSGIPFTLLKPKEREELVKATGKVLNPGGRFVAYQITTVLADPLKRHFSKVKTEFEIRSLPPQFVFTALR